MTFAEAFADARKRLGPGKTFTYKGKKYTIEVKKQNVTNIATARTR